MATSYTTTIKNLKPQGWSRQTVADGQALNNSFLEPTHQKDLKLAEGLDATNDRIDSVNTQMTSLGQRVSNAESTIANIGEDVQTYDREIAQLNSNLQIVSAAEGELATSLGTITEKLNEHKNLVSVDNTTIAGDGSTENPYTVIGGGGGSSKVYVPNVDGGNLSYTLSAASAAETQIGPWDIKGPKGQDGYSPTFTTAELGPTTQHPQGGTEITITFGYGQYDTTTYSAWNGNNGAGATVNLIEGNGIKIDANGSDYTLSVSADYSGAAVTSAKEWAENQFIANNALNPENSISGKWRNGEYYDFGLKASAENALADVVNKVSIPSNQTANVYVWNATQNPSDSGWKPANEVLPNALAPSFIKWSALPFAFSANNGLSASYGDNEEEFIVGLATSGIDANTQYAWTTSGWKPVQGGGGGTIYDIIGNNGISAKKDIANDRYEVGLSAKYMSAVSADTSLSGDGATSALGINMANAYTIDGTNGITAVPDATTNKVVVQMTNDVYQDVQHLHTSASIWDSASAVNYKSNVNITSAGTVTVNNTSGTSVNKFTQYAEVASHPTPRMFLCATADTVEDITGVLTAASGMGAIVFVIESHS